MRRKGDSPEEPEEPPAVETSVPKKLARRAAQAFSEVEFTLKAPSTRSLAAAES